MSAPVERAIELPQLTLRALAWGDGALPPLLALHGWLDNAGSYAYLAPRLAERRHVIALELPGHGHSDHLPPGMHYHFVDYVRGVLAAVDRLGLERFDLIGHSLGAGIAALVAAATPARIRRLLLIEGLGPLGDDGTRTLARFREGIDATVGSKGLRVFRDIDQAVSARVIAGGLRADLARPIVERGLAEVADGWCWRSDPRLTRTSPLRLAETQILALLRGIEAPTALLLARPETVYLPGEPMARRATYVADIAVNHMDGGHHLHLEHPEAVAAWALDHLGAP